jgi:hypothetical protein
MFPGIKRRVRYLAPDLSCMRHAVDVGSCSCAAGCDVPRKAAGLRAGRAAFGNVDEGARGAVHLAQVPGEVAGGYADQHVGADKFLQPVEDGRRSRSSD